MSSSASNAANQQVSSNAIEIASEEYAEQKREPEPRKRISYHSISATCAAPLMRVVGRLATAATLGKDQAI